MNIRLYLLIRLVVLGLLISCSSVQEEPHEIEIEKNNITPPKVSTTVLKKADFHLQTISNGILQPSISAELLFETPGILEKTYYNNGETVNKGNVIATLKNNRQLLALRKSEELLKGAETELYSLILGFGGKQSDTSSVGNKLLQSLKSQSGYTMAQLNLQESKMNYENTILVAPFRGVIASLEKQKHSQISTTKPFCSLFDRDSFVAHFTIIEHEFPKLKIGQNIKVFPIAYDSVSVYGRIIEIDPRVNENGLIKVKALVNKRKGHIKSNLVLLAGMNIKVIIEEIKPNQLFIPKSALVLRSGKKVVFTYSGGMSKWNYVEITSENSTSYLITQGLSENDTIIIGGGLHLAHDAVVEIENNP